MLVAFLIFVFGLCWGSFLNVVAYRLAHDVYFFTKRSHCPTCHSVIAWYDLIPVFSWVFLRGRCRMCATRISWLYPFIELVTGIFALLFWLYVPWHFWFGYGLLGSALIVTMRTDTETLTIDRLCTLFILPLAWPLSFLHLLPISLFHSLIGAVMGYGILAVTRLFSRKYMHHEGVGQGDLELLATIGAFTGPFGCWLSLVIGACLGSFFGIILKLLPHQPSTAGPLLLPFGTFLALGALISIAFSDAIYLFLFS